MCRHRVWDVEEGSRVSLRKIQTDCSLFQRRLRLKGPLSRGGAGPHRQGAATGPRCAPGPVAAPCLPLRCPRAARPLSSPQRPAALPAGSRARARRFRPTSAFPAPLSREFAPPHARLAGSPGRFARVPSAISVTARPYQSAAGAHR